MTYKDIHLKRRVKKFSSAFCVENDEKLNKCDIDSVISLFEAVHHLVDKYFF